jgi:hypothetical protein
MHYKSVNARPHSKHKKSIKANHCISIMIFLLYTSFEAMQSFRDNKVQLESRNLNSKTAHYSNFFFFFWMIDCPLQQFSFKCPI